MGYSHTLISTKICFCHFYIYQPEATWNIWPKYSRFQSLNMAPNICLLVQNMSITCHLVKFWLVLIGEDDARMESFHHEQSFTKGSWTLS